MGSNLIMLGVCYVKVWRVDEGLIVILVKFRFGGE